MITRPITAILPPEDDEFQGLVVPRQSSRVGASGAGVKLLQVTSPIPRPFLPYAAERTVAGSYTVDTTDQDPDGYIVWNVSGGNATFRLPSAASCPGREIVILRSDNTPSTVGTIVVAVSSADTIAGASTLALNNQYECVTLQSDGNSTWGVVSHVGASSAANPSTQIGVAKVAVTANVSSMSGTGTYDGVGLLVGDVIMLTGQSTGSQNGPWTIQSSNWTRPSWYVTGASITAGSYVAIETGTSNGPTIWQLSGSSVVTVDTTATSWARPGNVVLGGDIGGTATSPKNVGMQGNAWTSAVPKTGQWPYWSGSSFIYADPISVGVSGQITCVATSNQTLSGLPFVDGIQTVDGSIILLTAQSTGSQNGPWICHSGAWTRPTWYYSGMAVGYAYTVMVAKGGSSSAYGWTMWMQSTPSVTVDTNASTWVQVQYPLNALAQGGATNGQVLAWNGSQWAAAALIGAEYISGLNIEWVSSTSINVKSGTCYIQSLSKTITFSSDTSVTGLSTAASTWYYVYAYLNGSTPSIEVSTTAPNSTPYSGYARSKSTDTSRRYLGAILANSGGTAICNFIRQGEWVLYRENTIGTTSFRVLASGVATIYTSVSCSAVVPLTSRFAVCRFSNTATSAGTMVQMFMTSSDATGTSAPPNGVNFEYGVYSGMTGTTLQGLTPLNSSQAFQYAMNAVPTAGGGYCDIIGYVEPRS